MTFLQSPLALAVGLTIVVLGLAACLVLALCLVAREGDNDKGDQ